MKILRNTEKFLVYLDSKKNKSKIIVKVSHKDRKKILREVKLIKNLKKSSKYFDEFIPEILSYGKIKKGIHKNKSYYKMKYISGKTFSQIMQENKGIYRYEDKLSNNIFQKLIFITKNFSKSIKKTNKPRLLKKLITLEYNKNLQKDLITRFEKLKGIKINSEKYKNCEYYLNSIFRLLEKGTNFKYLEAKIGHWNYHGGNIIVKNKNKFYLIDPDATWDYNDPFFSLARFIYTYPHDTIENNLYLIKSNHLEFIANNQYMNFSIKNIWKRNVKKNYNFIFKKYFFNLQKNFKKNNLTLNEYIRISMCIILCFLRGINSNFEKEINFQHQKENIFRNKSIYIYLYAIMFLKNFYSHIKKIH